MVQRKSFILIFKPNHFILVHLFQLNDSSFDILDPNKHRYNYVDHLTLDNNQLTLTLDNNQLTSLLEIPLSIHFSIRKNNITSVSLLKN